MTTFARTIGEIRTRFQRAGNMLLNEQSTKAILFEPVLRALGWDMGQEAGNSSRDATIRRLEGPGW